MNNHGHMFDAFIYATIQSMRAVAREITEEELYEIREYGCTSNLTDEDMLKLHIDIALKNDDKKTFMKLTEQLGVGERCQSERRALGDA